MTSFSPEILHILDSALEKGYTLYDVMPVLEKEVGRTIYNPSFIKDIQDYVDGWEEKEVAKADSKNVKPYIPVMRRKRKQDDIVKDPNKPVQAVVDEKDVIRGRI